MDNYHKLSIIRMFHIKKEQNLINNEQDINNSGQIFHTLILNT